MEFLSSNKWFLLACVALALFAYLFRYDIRSVNANSPAAYVLDRWTGQVELISEDSPPMASEESDEDASKFATESGATPSPYRIRYQIFRTIAQ